MCQFTCLIPGKSIEGKKQGYSAAYATPIKKPAQYRKKQARGKSWCALFHQCFDTEIWVAATSGL